MLSAIQPARNDSAGPRPVVTAAPRGAARRPFLATVAALAASFMLAGCATSGALRRGRDAEQRQDYDRAVAEYTQALRTTPGSADARLGLDRTRLRASQDHFTKARRFAALGKLDEALVEYGLASELNPTDPDIDRELRSTRSRLRAQIAVPADGKTELQALIDRSRDLPPPGLDLPPNVKMPATLTFRDASSRDVFASIARFANISLVFDSAFRPVPITIDLRGASLDDALRTVAGITHTFFRVTAPATVAVVPDTEAKRREYEEEVVRTFYLSNADVKETMDALRLVLDARRISATTATNAVTIKDTPEHVAAAARLITAIDKARPEVIIDVELLEVNRTKLLDYGLQIASPDSPPSGIDGSASVNPATSGQTLTLQALRNLSQSDVLLANLPSLYYRLLKSDTNTRTLANPQLRTSDGITAQARFGEQVPVPTTTFAPIATGGVAQQPITAFEYRNIGVNIDITPRTHHDDDVTLVLKIAVTSVSGSGFGGLPTFGNREINTQIRLRDGETNMLAGLIRDEERHSLDGIPGLSDIPGVGRLFARNQKTTDQTDIVLTLTPHIIRVLDLDEADLRAFRVGRDDTAPGTAPEPPEPSQPAPPGAPAPSPGAAPGAEPAPSATTPVSP
jgi:general secretion pathway protein D